MLVSIALILLLAMVAIGWGSLTWALARRMIGLETSRPLHGELGLIGLLAIGALATAANFAGPITSTTAVLIGLAGLVALVAALLRRSYTWPQERGRYAATLLATTAALAGYAGTARVGYDAGLYHLPVQLWMRTEPVILGFANLHDRFGFNSIHESQSALLLLPSGDLRLIALGESLYFLFFFAALAEYLLRRHPGQSIAPALMCVLAPMSFLIFHDYYPLAITFNDSGAGLVFLLCTMAFLRSLDTSAPSRQRCGAYLSFFLLTTLAILLKLSSAPLLLLVAWATVGLVRDSIVSRKTVVRTAAVSLALGLPTVMRGIALSGCVAYPEPGSCLTFLPWSAEVTAETASDAVRGWARAPHTSPVHRAEVLDGAPWLEEWWEWYYRDLTWLLILPVALLALTWVAAGATGQHNSVGRAARSTSLSKALRGLAVFEVAALAFWFVQAPDTRFGLGAWHLLTLLPATLVYGRRVHSEGNRATMSLAAIGLPLIVWAAISLTGAEPLAETWGRDPWTFEEIVPPVVETTPNTGLGVHPVEGDQCWLVEDFCSPFDTDTQLLRRGRYWEIDPEQ